MHYYDGADIQVDVSILQREKEGKDADLWGNKMCHRGVKDIERYDDGRREIIS